MNQWYTLTTAPELPEIIDGAICAVCVQDNWYRVQIISHNSQAKTCLVKYLDFGGYCTAISSELRQIHADFMTVPFQAIECVMSNIRAPNNGEWSKEAGNTIQSFTQGVILQAQIAGYTQDDLPEVFLFASITKDVSYLNYFIFYWNFTNIYYVCFRMYCLSTKNSALVNWRNGFRTNRKDNNQDAIRLV